MLRLYQHFSSQPSQLPESTSSQVCYIFGWNGVVQPDFSIGSRIMISMSCSARQRPIKLGQPLKRAYYLLQDE